MENKVRKCIKGFDNKLKCLDFQYEVGKSYKLPKGEHVEICKNGFHAIDEDENPLKVFNYYSPCSKNGNPNRYCEVEIGGKTQKFGEKIVGSEIMVVREIGIEGLTEVYKQWVKRHPEVGVSEENADCSVASNTGDYSVASNSGDWSVAFNTGYGSVASNTGWCSVASNTGFCSIASNNGLHSVAFNTGDNSVASNMGACSVASNTGACSVASNNGNNSGVMNVGRDSFANAEGKNSVAVVTGYRGRVKGALGCAIVAVEHGEWDGESLPIKSIASSIVDGVKIKADTWYKCKNGELVEC